MKWSEVKYSEVKYTEVKYSEVKWSVVKWDCHLGFFLLIDFFVSSLNSYAISLYMTQINIIANTLHHPCNSMVASHLLPSTHKEVFRLLKLHMSNAVTGSAYNWVRPSLWSAVFGLKDKKER